MYPMTTIRPKARRPDVIKSTPGPPTSFAIVGSPASDGGDSTWVDPVSTGGLAIAAYRLFARTPQGSGVYSEVAFPGFGTAPPYTIESFTPATAYDLYVVAVNALGDSAPSNVIQITTAA